MKEYLPRWPNASTRFVRGAYALACAILAIAAFAATLEVLRSAYVAFVNLECSEYSDYTLYTNVLWNTANGRFFMFGAAQSYLATHLSFTLALLAPLFRLWDDPLVLVFTQWVFHVFGGMFIILIGKKLRMPWLAVLAILPFWMVHYFAQSVLLREFHGVCLYLLLVPALYYCLLAHRRLVWIPFVLILGMREETGLVIAPLLLYVAVTQRWRPGYVYAAVALVYALLAIFVLFPWINDMSIIARRHKELKQENLDTYWSASVFRARLESLAMILLPLAPLLWKAWRPTLAVMAAPVLLTLFSTEPPQVRLIHHYTAVILAFSAVAMLDAGRSMMTGQSGRRIQYWIFPVWLVCVTWWSYYDKGLMRGSRPEAGKSIYQKIDPAGLRALRMVREHVPAKVMVYAPRELRSFLANRVEVSWHKPRRVSAYAATDVVIEKTPAIYPDLLAGVSNGEWRIVYSDDRYSVLRRTGALPSVMNK